MLVTVRTLADEVAAFRNRFKLSKAKAAEVLGVSSLYVRSIEEGRDVRTGLPFTPRESTLRQLAARMTEFGYTMTFERLRDAADDQALQASTEAVELAAATNDPADLAQADDAVTQQIQRINDTQREPPVTTEALAADAAQRVRDLPADERARFLAELARQLGVAPPATKDPGERYAAGLAAIRNISGARDGRTARERSNHRSVAPRSGKTIAFPFPGELGAGARLELEHPVMVQVPVELAKGATFVVVARGNSMTGADIADGAQLFVKDTRQARAGQLVVAHVNHEGATVKRLETIGGKPHLVADSLTETHEPALVDASVTILGVVKAIEPPRGGEG
jgi:SOS-response transcriptional repressor LexA/transcriptional regulator with XRE-family HTH domain